MGCGFGGVCLAAFVEERGDGVDVVDAAAPDASAGLDEGGPEAGVVGEIGMWREVGARSSLGKKLGGNFGAHRSVRSADEVDRAGEIFAIDDDLDLVAVAEFADGAAGEGLGRDVADAGAGGDAAEARVGEDGDVLAEGEGLERGGDLVDLLHARAGGAAADEDHDVAFDDLAGLDGVDGGGFGGEDLGGTEVAVDAVGIDEGRVDGGALDDGAFGREIADGEADGGGEAAGAGAVGGHDDVVGIDAVLLEEILAEGVAARAVLPPVEGGVEGFAGDGLGGGVEQAGAAQVQHDLGHAAGEEDLHGGVVAGAVGQRVDEARDLAVDVCPVFGGWAVEPGGVGDGGDVEQEIGRAAEGRVDDHGVADGGVGEDV